MFRYGQAIGPHCRQWHSSDIGRFNILCRVPVTAPLPWPNALCKIEGKVALTSGSTGLNREHPTCTELQTLTLECGWKGGNRSSSAFQIVFSSGGEELVPHHRKPLTLTGLLMEGLCTH